ncbi:hypothetical protein QQS21_002964 [Conoideocrella luteorostrata]|uniref:Serine peptidase n=1 Tax=Conoideocrella luteorostrata TaxID=1105319 RepID=A0AAJ0CY97_9HYPO|nr:hypothetical protein QQS21_002964 [Conoideocrella luteorostrata]
MRLNKCFSVISSIVLAGPVAAWVDRAHPFGRPPPPEDHQLATAGADGPSREATFQQLIDHKNPGLGTFSQRYWYNAQYYAGPGSPIVLNAPGESDASDFYTTNATLPGMFGKTNGAAVIVVEHRYWGESSPYKNLSTTNLQYLTLDNAIQDLIYFAKNVELPFDVNGTSKPDKAPWVLTGCSYSGALSAWIYRLAPGTFWAYHCSSAVVEAISDFWQYNQPIAEAMPKNCTKDMQKAIKHIDGVLSNGTAEAQHSLKKRFGLEAITHNDDFGQALIGGLQGWQGTMFYQKSRPNPLYQFCDYIENVFPDKKNRTIPGPEGVGTCKALNGFAKWSREVMIPGSCAKYGYWKDNNTVACYDMNNKDNPYYHDLSVNNTINRQWTWFTCNEPFEWWQVSSPDDTTGLVSKFLDVNYNYMQCRNYFPREGNHTFGLDAGRTSAQVNRKTGGWNVGNTTRLMWVNGEYDPWKPATVSADARPGGPLQSTPDAPVWVIPKAAHCNDVLTKNADANPEVRKIVDDILATMKKWVGEYYVGKDHPSNA